MTLLLTLLIMAVIGLVAAVAAGRIGGGLDDPASSLPGRGLPPGPFTLEDVDKVRQAWPQAEVHVYEGAEHGFICDQRASFHPASADVARGRSEAFLTEHLAG